MFEDFLSALIGAIGTGAGVAGDLVAPAAESAAEFTPELAQLGLAGTEAAATAAPSVVETAAPSFMAAGPEFSFAADAVPNQSSAFYAPLPDANPNAVTGPGGVGSSGTSGNQSLEMASPGSRPSALSGMNVTPPPTAWESAQQIPGKWWQGVQNAPEAAGKYAAENPFKTAAGVASLGMGAFNAANPPEPPRYPNFSFPAAAPPRSGSASPDVPPGPPRSPLTRGSRGGMNVRPSPGIRQGAGATNV